MCAFSWYIKDIIATVHSLIPNRNLPEIIFLMKEKISHIKLK